MTAGWTDATVSWVAIVVIGVIVSVLAVNLSYADGYKRGYDAGQASCCPDEIEVDEVTR